ncbi:MAG: hypothetical protein QOF20_2661, partial [Acidimicrobiaceae bacterium]|nr:hypothetical protein [Acidimicrobiaceae bacterium]
MVLGQRVFSLVGVVAAWWGSGNRKSQGCMFTESWAPQSSIAIAGLGPGGPSTQTETKAKPEHAQPEIPLKAEPPTEALDKVFAGIPAPAGV